VVWRCRGKSEAVRNGHSYRDRQASLRVFSTP
jgi:hypothetical protein